MILFGLAIAFTLTCFMTESYKTVILRRRAKRLGIRPPGDSKSTVTGSVRYFLTKTITRPIYMMCTEPVSILVDA